MQFGRTSALVLLLMLGSCVSSPPEEVPDVLSQLLGRWDEPHENFCAAPQVLSFDDTRQTMLITYADVGWVTETDSRKIFRYKILSVGASAIRVALENEPRLDAEGKPVIWHVVVIDQDTYCWGRDDWPSGACTPPRKRCGI